MRKYINSNLIIKNKRLIIDLKPSDEINITLLDWITIIYIFLLILVCLLSCK